MSNSLKKHLTKIALKFRRNICFFLFSLMVILFERSIYSLSNNSRKNNLRV